MSPLRRFAGHAFAADYDDVQHVVAAEAQLGAVSAAACGRAENWAGLGMDVADGVRVCRACFDACELPCHDVTLTLCGPERPPLEIIG